jgi:hypothetical protein
MNSIISNDEAESYTIRVSKGAALIAETRLLLREWNPGEDTGAFAARVLSRDLLGKATARRVHDIVQRCFAPRYLAPPGCPARHLKRLIEERPSGDWFRDLCLIYCARADRLVRDAISVFLADAREEGRLTLTVEAAIAFLVEAERNGMMSKPWATETKRKIARGLLKLLAEFGLLSNDSRKAKEIRVFNPHPLAVAYLAFEMHFSGITDASIPEDDDWSLWLLNRESVRERLDELSRYGLWVFQAAGSVVRISWNVSSMEEAVDVLAGLDI